MYLAHNFCDFKILKLVYACSLGKEATVELEKIIYYTAVL